MALFQPAPEPDVESFSGAAFVGVLKSVSLEQWGRGKGSRASIRFRNRSHPTRSRYYLSALARATPHASGRSAAAQGHLHLDGWHIPSPWGTHELRVKQSVFQIRLFFVDWGVASLSRLDPRLQRSHEVTVRLSAEARMLSEGSTGERPARWALAGVSNAVPRELTDRGPWVQAVGGWWLEAALGPSPRACLPHTTKAMERADRRDRSRRLL